MFSYLFHQGGAILWLIVAIGVAAVVVYVERSLHLHRARIKSDDFLKGIFNILRRENITEALTICDETPGPVAYIVKTAILHRHESRETLRSAVENASLAEISRMERRLVFIATVAQAAPLLGLLGTVLGMLDAVLVMQHQGPLVQAGDLMGGLLKALVATAGGLTVAIPCYAMFNVLVVRIDSIVLDMERAASETVAFLKEPKTQNGSAGRP
jgi:biopolymer transport protein ExbB